MKDLKQSGNEIVYDGSAMITETDITGNITYANRQFMQMTGYSYLELIGQSHNIVRHPEMPALVFKQMWSRIREGRIWHGYVQNVCKDGKHFWADVYITPGFNDNRELSGYIAARKPVDPRMLKQIKRVYATLRAKEKRGLAALSFEELSRDDQVLEHLLVSSELAHAE